MFQVSALLVGLGFVDKNVGVVEIAIVPEEMVGAGGGERAKAGEKEPTLPETPVSQYLPTQLGAGRGITLACFT